MGVVGIARIAKAWPPRFDFGEEGRPSHEFLYFPYLFYHGCFVGDCSKFCVKNEIHCIIMARAAYKSAKRWRKWRPATVSLEPRPYRVAAFPAHVRTRACSMHSAAPGAGPAETRSAGRRSTTTGTETGEEKSRISSSGSTAHNINSPAFSSTLCNSCAGKGHITVANSSST